MDAPAVIRFSHASKTYPGYTSLKGGIKTFLFNLRQSIRELRRRTLALEDISFEIRQGESFGLIGANGAGKSTLLGLIAGVLFPDKGSVEVRGRVSPLLQLGAGFHPDLTGRENILLNGVLLGLNLAQVKERQDEIIQFSTLDKFIDQPVRTYSSGMFAKLGFSVVANLNPEILLIDEILAVGDVGFAQRCTERMAHFREDPTVTLVLVSHSLTSVARICNRAAWIENNRLRMIGPAEEVVDAYRSSITISVPVDARLETIPLHLTPSNEELRLHDSPKALRVKASGPAEELVLDMTLYDLKSQARLRRWVCPLQEDAALLKFNADAEATVSGAERPLDDLLPSQGPETKQRVPTMDRDAPLALELILRHPDGTPATVAGFLPMSLTAKADRRHEQHRTDTLDIARRLAFPQRLRAPLWTRGCTIHVVARNIFPTETVGRFALDAAGAFAAAGVNVRVYAHVYPLELTGTVLPMGRLLVDIDEEDIILYNYSVPDEFLSRILRLSCGRVLYYHGVTPGESCREPDRALATLPDDSRSQFDLFRHFQAVLAGSRFSLNELQGKIEANAFQGIHPPMLSPTELEAAPADEALPKELQGDFLLWTGGIAPRKRLDFALRLFESAADRIPGCSLVLAENGCRACAAHTEHLDAILAGLPPAVRARIHFLENPAPGQLRALYEQATALLCTSPYEGFGMPLYEAMRFQLPILWTAAPGSEETLGGAGQLLPEDLPEAADTLVRVLADPQALERLRNLGQQRGQELFAMADGTALWEAVEVALKPHAESAASIRKAAPAS